MLFFSPSQTGFARGTSHAHSLIPEAGSERTRTSWQGLVVFALLKHVRVKAEKKGVNGNK